MSLESPLKDIEPGRTSESVSHNSLHCTPKAFAHFFAWWRWVCALSKRKNQSLTLIRLFNSTLSLPIRQGKLFPASPPPSRKFGRSLGTIKYRIDLRIVYISHMYSQISRQLWDQGKSQSLGVKAKFGRFRGDMHQRAQEKVVRHNKLDRVKVVTHKPFYATDLILEDIEIKGIRAEFDEHPSHHHHRSHDGGDQSSSDESSSIEEFNFPKAGEMESGDKAWFNLFDFVDADKRPMDPDPRIELVDFGDCPEIFFSMRTKVQPTTPGDDDSMRSDAGSDDGTERQHDLERSKFGDEPTHVCYLRTNKSVAPIQIKITRERIRELQHIIDHIPAHKQVSQVRLLGPSITVSHNYRAICGCIRTASRSCMPTSMIWRARRNAISTAIHSRPGTKRKSTTRESRSRAYSTSIVRGYTTPTDRAT